MPQPPEVVEASADIIALFSASAARLDAEQARILESIYQNPRLARRLNRVQELRVVVDAEIASLRDVADNYARQVLPAIYARGGVDSGLVAGSWTWSQLHRRAINELTDANFAEVARALDVVDADAAAWIRRTSRAATASAVIEGRTPQEVARAFRQEAGALIDSDGTARSLIATVYSNGARVPMQPYTQMLIRTQTALAYNAGTLNETMDAGVRYVEILDGNDCGVNGHDDPRKANGLIILATEAAKFPISHPNCRRAFAPRPDILSADEARSARRRNNGSVVDDGARIDQAVSERLGSRSGRTPFTGADADRAGVTPLRAGRPVRQPRASRSQRATIRDADGNRVSTVNPDTFLDTEQAYSRNGVYNPTRSQLHDDIVDDFLDGIPVSDQPTMYMTGGGPASGKSSMINANPDRFPTATESVHIDPDAVKLRLPDYQRMVRNSDNRAAAFAHEESSYLSKRVIADALGADVDILYDSVGDSGIDKLSRKIAEAADAGHRVVANYASNDLDLAVRLSELRAAKTGRRVPLDYLRSAHADVTDTFVDAVSRGLFDEAFLWDTNVKDEARLVLSFVNGRVKINDPALFADFVSKGTRSFDAVTALLPT